MTTLVSKPLNLPKVKGKGVYEVWMNGKPLGLTIRAKNAPEADLMLREVFRHELAGKYLEFDSKDFEDYNDAWNYGDPDQGQSAQEQNQGVGQEDLPGLVAGHGSSGHLESDQRRQKGGSLR